MRTARAARGEHGPSAACGTASGRCRTPAAAAAPAPAGPAAGRRRVDLLRLALGPLDAPRVGLDAASDLAHAARARPEVLRVLGRHARHRARVPRPPVDGEVRHPRAALGPRLVEEVVPVPLVRLRAAVVLHDRPAPVVGLEVEALVARGGDARGLLREEVDDAELRDVLAALVELDAVRVGARVRDRRAEARLLERRRRTGSCRPTAGARRPRPMGRPRARGRTPRGARSASRHPRREPRGPRRQAQVAAVGHEPLRAPLRQRGDRQRRVDAERRRDDRRVHAVAGPRSRTPRRGGRRRRGRDPPPSGTRRADATRTRPASRSAA